MPADQAAIIRKAPICAFEAIFILLQEFASSFPPERDAFEESARYLIADDSAWLAVAEMEGKIVGYCLGFDHYTFYANGRVSWVEEVTVQADQRRAGIGRAMMQHFEAWACERESMLVALATRRASFFIVQLDTKKQLRVFES